MYIQVPKDHSSCLYGKQSGVLVADRVGIPAAVLISPNKVGTLQVHDDTLSIINRARLTLCPVGFSHWFIAQPVPLSTASAPTHPYPQVHRACMFAQEDFVVDLCLVSSPGKAYQLQLLILAVLKRLSPSPCHCSNCDHLWDQKTAPEV